MVASDTVVGIVGAVVLVAVMAGVFVYEYNNPATDDGVSGGGASLHEFTEQYPALDATQDLDGDGKSNLMDDDMDGDGTVNANDTDVGVSKAISGMRSQAVMGPDAGQSFPFYVGNGSVHTVATITYTRTAPPVGTAGTPTFTATIVNDAGETVATSTPSGTSSVTLTAEIAEGLPYGNYTVVVKQSTPSPGGAFSGTVDVHYEAPVVLDHEHD